MTGRAASGRTLASISKVDTQLKNEYCKTIGGTLQLLETKSFQELPLGPVHASDAMKRLSNTHSGMGTFMSVLVSHYHGLA